MTSDSSESIADLISVLRSNLNATELILAKFSSATRRQIVTSVAKSPKDWKPENVSLLVDSVGKMQADFSKFKSSSDILLALFEHLP